MAQKAYGTITITDTNDIEKIYMVYAGSSSDTTAPDKTNFSLWKTDITQVTGDYIWQRTVVKKSGITITSLNFQEYYGDPVCITGPEGAAARKITSVVPYYYLSTSNSNQTGGNWSTTPAAYPATGTYYYWTKTITTYDSGSPTESSPVLDKALNSANETARNANTTANSASQTANQTQTNLNNYITSNNNAVAALQTRTKHFWDNLHAHTYGTDGWTKPNYPVGTYAASGISGTTFDEEDSSTYGYNTLYANGIKLRYNAINLGELTGSSLIFYKPSTTSQGGKAMELSGSALKFYNPENGSISMMDLTSSGLTFKTAAGATIGTFGSDASGGLLDLSGRLNIKGGGRIGQDSDNYWEFGDNRSYNDEDSAYLMGKGTASIQLGETGHWRLDKNRIHTGWYQLSDTTAGIIHFDTGADNGTTYYWDYGLYYPNKSGGGNNKFVYIRRSNSSTSSASLATMKGRIDDDTEWTYKFYVDGNGDVHAQNFYAGDTLIGGNDSAAGKLTVGAGSATHPVYFRSDTDHVGEVAETTYALNAAGAKGVITDIANNTTSADLPTTAAVVSYVTSRGYITSYTDNKVQTSQANTTKIYLAGTSTAQTNTGTLNFDSNVYLTTTAGTLHATTFEGSLSGTASRATADSDGNTIKTTYLKLSGGQVTGPVTFGSSVSADELTTGDLVVNGAASFTNNLQANTINGVAVGSSPKFTDTNYYHTSGSWGGTNSLTYTATANGGAGALAFTLATASTSVYGVTKLSDATNSTSTVLAATANAVKKAYDLAASKTANTGTVTSVAASGSGGITISGSPITTEGTITIGLNLSTAINGLGEGTSNANRNDYIVAQYAGGGTTTTTYHRRSLAHIFAALNSSDITTALGYTPPTTDTNTHRPIQLDSTEILGNNTTALNLKTGGGITLSNSSGTVTIAHKDTSSQSTSTNSGRTYIQSVTLDTYGHVTGLSTATETVTDTHYTTHLYVGTSDGSVNAATTNDNTYLMVLDSTTVRDRRKISGSGAATVTSDSSGNITINSPIAITGVSFANGTITFTKSDNTTIPITTDNFVITQASGATALVKLKSGSTTEYEGYSAGGATTAPVYFDNDGHPVAVTSIPWSLIASKPSSYTPSSHTHGNITNDGKITTTATIASGDKLVIVDTDSTAGNKITGSSITFGTSETTFLTNKGTWKAPSGSVTGVKGNSESDYRTGQVNITKANIGLGNVDNTADANKNVLTATKFSSSRTITLTGDVTGSASGDGSSGWSISTTVGDDSHFHTMAYSHKPIQSKTYANTSYYATSSGSWEAASWYFMSVKPDTWDKPWKIRIRVHSFCPGYSNVESYTDALITGRRDGLAYSNYTERLDTAHYYIPYYTLKQAGFNAGLGHAIGVSILYGTGYTTAAYYRTFEVDFLEYENCTVTFFDTPIKWSSWTNGNTTNYNNLGSLDAVTRGYTQSGDRNDANYQNRLYYTYKKPYATLYRYQILLSRADGTLLPVNSVDNAPSNINKTLTTEEFDPFGEIYCYNTTTTKTTSQNLDNNVLYRQVLADLRYSFNITNESGKCLTGSQPVYIVATPQSNGMAKLASPALVQALPSTEDGKIYIYIGQAYPDTYPYRTELPLYHPIYWYKNGAICQYVGNPYTVNGHTVASDVPANAVFTDTWKALSTSQAGYVSQAPNDTSKFLRGDASWAAVTKGNVGLGNVDNTADANKRVKGANITTTANAVAYYTDTTGTFGSKASANGALYATSANGALSWGTLPVAQGGTGATSFTANSVIISGSSTTAALTTRAITNVTSGAVTASTNLVTANSLIAHVANKIAAASDTYVTLNTNQTLTAAGTKTYLGLQTYGTSGLALGVTSGTSVTQKANVKYDSTLEALVFSFA